MVRIKRKKNNTGGDFERGGFRIPSIKSIDGTQNCSVQMKCYSLDPKGNNQQRHIYPLGCLQAI